MPPIPPTMAMYPSARRRSRGARTRGELLKAAKALFVLLGLTPVTVEDICLAAGVSKGGFYYHFADKERAFLEIALEELKRDLDVPGSLCLDAREESGASPLLLDLWAWTSRRPAARRRVRAVHRRSFKRLATLAGRASGRKPPEGDREAQAALALFSGTGRMVQGVLARRTSASQRERRRAAGDRGAAR